MRAWLSQRDLPAAGAEDVPADVARAVETIMSRDHILHKVRTALGRSVDQPPPTAASGPHCVSRGSACEAKIDSFCARLEALAGKTHRAATPAERCDYVGA